MIPNFVINTLIKLGGLTKMFTKIQAFLDGKKAYIGGASIILAGLLKYSQDGDVAQLIKTVMEGISIMALKAAIVKSGQTPQA